ncbi:MAG TPA: pyridoxamine 5'-phosphate oxidase family protein, partial [Pyrinomonadaceae bacterium]|nr:pyridoxamine 5'-phosphate oxidase family protein [Pyrinomonadaceae bacterium]
MKEIKQTNRTKLKRLPKRGNFDRDVVNSILDEALVCHVGFVVDGKPFVIPTSFGRIGDTLVIHGSAASRMMRNLSDGIVVRCGTASASPVSAPMRTTA